MSEQLNRDGKIIRTSIIGILTNVLLAGFKAAVGVLSRSIAIVMDAVNNLSDAASSIITIIGTKLAGREADREHPFGYGRIEYLSAMVIAMLVLYAGVTALIESVKKIITPDVPDYGVPTLIVVAVAVLVKIILGRYVKKTGEQVNSDSLVNSGADALMDAVISASTLAAAVIFLTTGLSLEAWLGAVIAILICKSGGEMLMDTVSKILGERAEAQLVRDIKKTVASFPEVRGAYDLILHNYGPDAHNGSIHIEVPDTITADELDKLTRTIMEKVHAEHGVILTGIGIYSYNTKDKDAIALREKVRKIVTAHPHVMSMHGFYIDHEAKTIRFDIVVSFEAEDRSRTFAAAIEDVRKAFPGYDVQAAMDMDFSEIS